MPQLPKQVHTFGGRFSRDLHLIFTNPREAVKVLIAEADNPFALSVPFFVVIVAAIMGVLGQALASDLGLTLTGIPLWQQTLHSVWLGLKLTFQLIVAPIALFISWIGLTIVFHFLGSIVAGKDITGGRIFSKTLKLTGFVFAPFFLNIIPLFPLEHLYIMPIVTGFWSVWIAYLAMKENYRTTRGGAFIIILPYLFWASYKAYQFFLTLGS